MGSRLRSLKLAGYSNLTDVGVEAILDKTSETLIHLDISETPVTLGQGSVQDFRAGLGGASPYFVATFHFLFEKYGSFP